jgi:DNA-directed RNA polymerase subunit RPC12/RpoP
MVKKFCSNCKRDAWHNAMRKAGDYRCTYCGSPISNHPDGKKMHAMAIMNGKRR